MSKVESFYWNKLGNKSFSFESEQFFDLCFVSAVQGVTLIIFSIKHSCVVGQKEFSRKTEDSKIESFSWNKMSSDNSCFELKQFSYCPFVFPI